MISQFKQRVAAYVRRELSSFNQGGVDLVLAAINDARNRAQRDYSFNLLEDFVFLETSLAGANFMTGCYTAPVGGVLVRVKKVNYVWEYTTAAVSGVTKYIPQRLYDFTTSDSIRRSFPSVTTALGAPYNPVQNAVGAGMVVQRGTKLYLPNIDTPTWIMLEAIPWLSNLDDNATADFFIDNFPDWMLFKTVQSLNAMLKEDQRVIVSQSLLNDAWESVKSFDAQIAASTQAVTLD